MKCSASFFEHAQKSFCKNLRFILSIKGSFSLFGGTTESRKSAVMQRRLTAAGAEAERIAS